MQLGIINGVYADKGYDHLKTLELAAGKHPDYSNFKVNVVQAYLNPDNIGDEFLLNQIKDKSKELGIELITHIHGLPSQNELDQVLRAHGILLNQQENKRTVIHYDSDLGDNDLDRIIVFDSQDKDADEYNIVTDCWYNDCQKHPELKKKSVKDFKKQFKRFNL